MSSRATREAWYFRPWTAQHQWDRRHEGVITSNGASNGAGQFSGATMALAGVINSMGASQWGKGGQL